MVNFASYNVRGLQNYTKRQKIFKYIRDKYYDIVFMQETHSDVKCEKLWRSQFGGQLFYSHGSSQARGCAIIVKKRIKTKVYKIQKCNIGRYIFIDLDINGERMLLCNIYAPNEDDEKFFIDIFTKINKMHVKGAIIIAGDFNTVITEFDKKGGNGRIGHPKAVNII